MQVIDRNGRLKVEITNAVEELTVGVTTIAGGVSGRALYDNAGILGELNLSSIYVPLTRTLTINGTTQDLSANRTFTVATGITIGTTAITSGVVGRVLFEGTGNVVSESANITWNNTDNALSLISNANLGVSALAGLVVTNSNASGYANTLWYNNLNDVGQFMMTGSTAFGFTGTNILTRQANFINAAGTGGINLLATAGNITFNAGGGSVSKVTMFTTGNVGINTTTDAGFKLDVNGTARVSGDATLGSSTTTGTVEVRGSNIVIFRVNDVLNNNNTGIYKNATSGYLFESSSANQLSYGYAGNYWMSWRNSTKSIAITSTGSEPTPAATSIFDLQSTTKGFLPPRMTTTQKNAIATPATGLMVYDNTINAFNFYNGTSWTNGVTISTGTTPITGGVAGQLLFQGTGDVVQQSANLFWDNVNGRLGVGTSTPTVALDIVGAGKLSTSLEVTSAAGITLGGGAKALSYTSSSLEIGNSATWTNVSFFTGGVNKFSQTPSATTINNTTINLSTATVQLGGVSALAYSGADIRIGSITAGFTSLSFYTAATEKMRIAATTGNLLLNTTTDAGFKLDVNGTARVFGDFTIGNNRYLKAFRWTNDDLTRPLQIEGNSNYNVDGLNIISWNNNLLNNTKNLVNIGLSSTVSTQSSGSTDFFNSVLIQTAYNFTNGTHTVKGIYYNPTLTSMVGTTHFAFHSTSGRVRFEGLPTSPAGLSSGDVWNDAGTLKIV